MHRVSVRTVNILCRISVPLAIYSALASILCACSEPVAARRDGLATANAESVTKGQWRLAPRDELSRVTLWSSHILIRHSQAEASQAPLVAATWKVLGPPPARTELQARELAEGVREDLLHDPSQFAEVAARLSEDSLTAGRGGRTGGLSAANLAAWPGALDALAQLNAGEISQVVETPWGFHIFKREAPPPEVRVNARHIVVGYAENEWLDFNQRIDRPNAQWKTRTRSEAFALASQITATLRETPEQFPPLLQQHSDHFDAENGGEIGTWSSREATPNRFALDALAELPVGGVTDPIDGIWGFGVWQRLATEEQPQIYAARTLRFRYDPTPASSAQGSKDSVRRQASDALAVVLKDPQQFSAVEQTYGVGTSAWQSGRGRRGEQRALQAVEIGHVTTELIDADWAFLILLRKDPREVGAPLEPLVDLPSPSAVSLDYHLAYVDKALRQELLESAFNRSRALESIGSDEVAYVHRLCAELATALARRQDLVERRKLVASFLSTLEWRLGVTRFAKLRGELEFAFQGELNQ